MSINKLNVPNVFLTLGCYRQCDPGNMAASVTGKPDDGQWYVDPQTHNVTYRFMLDDHKEYFKWLNHMNDIDLLDG